MLKNFKLNHPSLNSEKFVQKQTLIYLSIKVHAKARVISLDKVVTVIIAQSEENVCPVFLLKEWVNLLSDR